MKKLGNLIIAFIIFVFHQGCDNSLEIDKAIVYKDKDLSIYCHINELEYKSIDENLYTYVKGSIEIISDGTDTVYFNLKNVRLQIENKEIGNIYINSIASINISEEKLIPHKTIKKNVYWVFDREIKSHEMRDIKIVYNNQSGG